MCLEEIKMNENNVTPTKTIFYMSPSCNEICILCQTEITKSTGKYRLWNSSGEKTDSCVMLEKCLSVTICNKTDLQTICKLCIGKVKRTLNKINEKRKLFEEGRKLAAQDFVRSKVKRLAKDIDDNSKRKKRLIYQDTTDDIPFSDLRIDEEAKEASTKNTKLVTWKSGVKIVETIPQNLQKLIAVAAKGNISNLLRFINQNFTDAAKTFITTEYLKTVESEVKLLTSQKSESHFRLNNIFDLSETSYLLQENELQQKAPYVYSTIMKIAINERSLKRNIVKTRDSIIPAIMNCTNTLLMCRSREMNRGATLTSMILKRGKADKMCFERLNSLQLCLSYQSMLNKQFDLGSEFKKTVQDWTYQQVQHRDCLLQKFRSIAHESESTKLDIIFEDDDENSSEIEDKSFFDTNAEQPGFFDIEMSTLECDNGSEASSDGELDPTLFKDSVLSDKPNTDCCPEITFDKIPKTLFADKFMKVGDNLDVKVKRRHMTIYKQNRDMHLYNLIAVKNRIDIPEALIGQKAKHIKNHMDIDLKLFIPSHEEEQLFREDVKFLVSKDLIEYLEDVKWMKKFVPKYLYHDHWQDTQRISEIHSLGILTENEATTEGITAIMREQHTYVPGHDSDVLVRTFAVGDLLTVERSQNAQDDLQDSTTPSKRLEGLIPALADFHTFGNFLEVVFHLIYDTSSSADIGTLYQARNFLNARNVSTRPMDNINASEELILKYAEALLLSAFDEYISSNNIDIKNSSGEDQYNEILDDFIRKYVITETPDVAPQNTKFECPHCDKNYQKIVTLKKHIKEKHKFRGGAEKRESEDDHLLNYSKNALTLCYLVKAFINARKHGDGERIIRLHKYLLLYFKVDGRTKYSYQVLHLLSQINFLLPPSLAYELKWNRSVNNKGQPDSNVELDRELEHRNKYVKHDLKNYQGKITDKSIKRCSRSTDEMKKILKNFDINANVDIPSGRHTVADWKGDVKQLAEQYKQAKIFQFERSRFHNSFPSFPTSYLTKIDPYCFKTWAYAKFKDFLTMNIYKHKDLITDP